MKAPNPNGLCMCGCGRRTPISDRTNARLGYVMGQPHRFVGGHDARPRAIRRDGPRGYVMVRRPSHPRATRDGFVLEHLVVAGAALGRPVMHPHEVHHVNGDPSDNRSSNLVLCEDHAYHHLLHQRLRALRACGHADWRKCQFCGAYDPPTHIHVLPRGDAYHVECHRVHERDRQRRNSAARRAARAEREATHSAVAGIPEAAFALVPV